MIVAKWKPIRDDDNYEGQRSQRNNDTITFATFATRRAGSLPNQIALGGFLRTSGLHPAEMIVIAARPSMGKTAFAMNIAEHVALHAGKAVAVFSLEMSSSQLVQRLLCSRAKVNLQKVRNGFLSDRDFPSLTAAAAKLAKSALFIDDTAGLSIGELRAKARRLKVKRVFEKS